MNTQKASGLERPYGRSFDTIAAGHQFGIGQQLSDFTLAFSLSKK